MTDRLIANVMVAGCRCVVSQAQVVIKGAGSVSLSWYTKKQAELTTTSRRPGEKQNKNKRRVPRRSRGTPKHPSQQTRIFI